MVYNVVLPLCIQTLTLEPLCFVGNVPYSFAILGEVGELGEGTPRKGQKPGIWGKHMQSFGGGRDRTSHFREIFQNVRNVLKCTENKHKQQRQKEETMNTKRLLGILLAMLLTVSAMFALVACNSNNNQSEVRLLSIEGSTKYNKQRIAKISAPQSVFASIGIPKYDIENPTEDTTGEGEETGGEDEEPAPLPDTPIEVDPTVVPAYTLIYKSQTTFFLTINLENPNNHYIMDFRLTCPGSDVSIKQGSQFSDINDPNTYIRWDEATDRVGNRMATFELRLNSPEVSPDRITISEMYYSSRADGANKTAVNTDGKETYTIYKIDGPMEMYDRKNNLTEFTFKLNTNGVSIISVTLDETENLTADETGTYHVLHDGKLDITYEYAVGDDQLPARITSSENIELLKIVNTLEEDNIKDPEKISSITNQGGHVVIYMNITGTDADIFTLNLFVSDNIKYTYFYNSCLDAQYFNNPTNCLEILIPDSNFASDDFDIVGFLKNSTMTVSGATFNLYSDIFMKLSYHSIIINNFAIVEVLQP